MGKRDVVVVVDPLSPAGEGTRYVRNHLVKKGYLVRSFSNQNKNQKIGEKLKKELRNSTDVIIDLSGFPIKTDETSWKYLESLLDAIGEAKPLFLMDEDDSRDQSAVLKRARDLVGPSRSLIFSSEKAYEDALKVEKILSSVPAPQKSWPLVVAIAGLAAILLVALAFLLLPLLFRAGKQPEIKQVVASTEPDNADKPRGHESGGESLQGQPIPAATGSKPVPKKGEAPELPPGLVPIPVGYPDYLSNARILMKVGRKEDALAVFQQGIEKVGKDDLEFVHEYMEALTKTGGPEKAEEVLAKIRVGHPDWPSAALIGIIRQNAERKEPAKSLEALDKLLTQHPGYTPGILSGVFLCEKTGFILDDLELDARAKAFAKVGGTESLRKFVPNHKSIPFLASALTQLESRSEPKIEERLAFKINRNREISLLQIFLRDPEQPKSVTLHFPGGDAEISDTAGVSKAGAVKGFVVELSGAPAGKPQDSPVFRPRKIGDNRGFPHVGTLDGLDQYQPVEIRASYVDARNRPFRFPQTFFIFGRTQDFSGEVVSAGSKSIPGATARPTLLIRSVVGVRTIQVSADPKVAFAKAIQHPAIPTLFEIECDRVPFFKTGGQVWIKSITDSDDLLENIQIRPTNNLNLTWETFKPTNNR